MGGLRGSDDDMSYRILDELNTVQLIFPYSVKSYS